jgi:hypothetical protein
MIIINPYSCSKVILNVMKNKVLRIDKRVFGAAAFCWKRWIHCGSICGGLIAGRSPRLLGQMSRSTCWSDEIGIFAVGGLAPHVEYLGKF